MTTMMRVSSLPNLSEIEKRDRRKSSYHLIASKNQLPHDPEEDGDHLYKYLLSTSPKCSSRKDLRLQEVKRQLILEIARCEGDVSTPDFQLLLEELLTLYDPDQFDARVRPKSKNPKRLEGMWINLSKPKFPDCLGKNKEGDCMYTLGRMSFGRFRPTNLVCSIQGTFNPVHFLKHPFKVLSDSTTPKALLDEIEHGGSIIRTYQIVTAFAIEPYDSSFGSRSGSPNAFVTQPIEGLLTTYGYVLSSPEKSNRLSIWFTGGTIEVRNAADPNDLLLWRQMFREAATAPEPTELNTPKEEQFVAAPPESSPRSSGRGFFRYIGNRQNSPPHPAPKHETQRLRPEVPSMLHMTMEPDGKMTYKLNADPTCGIERAYVDLLYLDETMRVVRANTGSVHVMARVPYFPDE